MAPKDPPPPLRRSTRPRRNPQQSGPLPPAAPSRPQPATTTTTSTTATEERPITATARSDLYTYYRHQLLLTGHRPSHTALNAWYAYTHSGATLPTAVLRAVLAGAAVRGGRAAQTARLEEWARGQREATGFWPGALQARGWMDGVGLRGGGVGVEGVLEGLRGAREVREETEGPRAPGGILSWAAARCAVGSVEEVETESELEGEGEEEEQEVIRVAATPAVEAEEAAIVAQPGNRTGAKKTSKKEPEAEFELKDEDEEEEEVIWVAATPALEVKEEAAIVAQPGKKTSKKKRNRRQRRLANEDVTDPAAGTQHRKQNGTATTRHEESSSIDSRAQTKPRDPGTGETGRKGYWRYQLERAQKGLDHVEAKRLAARARNDTGVMGETIIVAGTAVAEVTAPVPVPAPGNVRRGANRRGPQIPALVITAQHPNNNHNAQPAHAARLLPLMMADEEVRLRLAAGMKTKAAAQGLTRRISTRNDDTAVVPSGTQHQLAVESAQTVPELELTCFKAASGFSSHAGDDQSAVDADTAAGEAIEAEQDDGEEGSWCDEGEWEVEDATEPMDVEVDVTTAPAEVKIGAGAIDVAALPLSEQVAGPVTPMAHLGQHHHAEEPHPDADMPDAVEEKPMPSVRARTVDAGGDDDYRRLAELINRAADAPQAPVKLEVDARPAHLDKGKGKAVPTTPSPPPPPQATSMPTAPTTPAPLDPLSAALGIPLSPRTAAKIHSYLDARVQSEVDSRLYGSVMARGGGSAIRQYIDATIQLELQARFSQVLGIGGGVARELAAEPLSVEKDKGKERAVEETPAPAPAAGEEVDMGEGPGSPLSHLPREDTRKPKRKRTDAADGDPGPSRRQPTPLPAGPSSSPAKERKRAAKLTADKELVAEFWAAPPLPRRARTSLPVDYTAAFKPAKRSVKAATPKPAPAPPLQHQVPRNFTHTARTTEKDNEACRRANRRLMRYLRANHAGAAPQESPAEETARHRAALMIPGVHVDARDASPAVFAAALPVREQAHVVAAGVRGRRPRAVDAGGLRAMGAALQGWYVVAASGGRVVTGRALERKVAELARGRAVPRGWVARWKRRHGVRAAPGPQGYLPEDPIYIDDDYEEAEQVPVPRREEGGAGPL